MPRYKAASQAVAIIEEAGADLLSPDVEEEIEHDARYAPNRFLEAGLRPLRHVWISMFDVYSEWPDNIEGASR